MVHDFFKIVVGWEKRKNSHGWYAGSDAALPGRVVREERVELRHVDNNSVPLVQIDFFEMVFIALVLGKIYKHLQRSDRSDLAENGESFFRESRANLLGPELSGKRSSPRC